jgi:hypothetical protein
MTTDVGGGRHRASVGGTLELLAATVRDLAPTADAPRLPTRHDAGDRLTAVATHADGRRRAAGASPTRIR